jgi:hypothetical protein
VLALKKQARVGLGCPPQGLSVRQCAMEMQRGTGGSSSSCSSGSASSSHDDDEDAAATAATAAKRRAAEASERTARAFHMRLAEEWSDDEGVGGSGAFYESWGDVRQTSPECISWSVTKRESRGVLPT